MEFLILAVFCGLLLFCIVLDLSILFALAAGLLLFLMYGRKKGFAWQELLSTALSGVKTVRNILITFALIGMLTALWRASGTIAVIVCYAAQFIRPSVFLLMTFLLNCGISVLTGTAFGTAATMGVICATMGATMHVSPLLVGGAVLSGAFFGDRCSPVSTSALLVSELTRTSIFQNIRAMVRTGTIPFLLTCGIYTLIGLIADHSGQIPDLQALFGQEFHLNWVALLPAVVIILLSLFQVNVKIVMAVSILTAIPICLFLQHAPISNLPSLLFFGFHAQSKDLAAMMDGGGIISMIRVGAIVCLSSSYSGIFRKTGLLDPIKSRIERLAQRFFPFAATVITAVVTSMVACNQTLAIMLTHQLCGELEPDPSRFALSLEDSVVVIAPLIPWSIAGAVPLAAVAAPSSSIFLACYLYLLPLCGLLFQHKKR